MIYTERLEIRLPTETDRGAFIELFGSSDFMVFSGGPVSSSAASIRFDEMLATAAEIPFAKQPVIERVSGSIVGYAGVARFDFEGRWWLEFGYRFVTRARGQGYATEAGQALLALARRSFAGEILAIIDPSNESSRRVARKLGFEYWKAASVGGSEEELWRVDINGTASASSVDR